MDNLHHILKWDTAMALSVDAMSVHVQLLDHKLDAIRWRAARNIADLRFFYSCVPLASQCPQSSPRR